MPPSSPPSSSPPGDPDFRAEWVAALDRLEIDVELAEALLTAPEPAALPEWTAPVMRGPLPADLEPRARLVLERQLAVAHQLSRRISATGRERRLADAVKGTGTPDIPVYVDVSA